MRMRNGGKGEGEIFEHEIKGEKIKERALRDRRRKKL